MYMSIPEAAFVGIISFDYWVCVRRGKTDFPNFVDFANFRGFREPLTHPPSSV